MFLPFLRSVRSLLPSCSLDIRRRQVQKLFGQTGRKLKGIHKADRVQDAEKRTGRGSAAKTERNGAATAIGPRHVHFVALSRRAHSIETKEWTQWRGSRLRGLEATKVWGSRENAALTHLGRGRGKPAFRAKRRRTEMKSEAQDLLLLSVVPTFWTPSPRSIPNNRRGLTSEESDPDQKNGTCDEAVAAGDLESWDGFESSLLSEGKRT
ncbi:unnamed protein product [Bursaphelenchus xylophilus]|uniref:(pine wood nematode) hypothetical protein n=1 Tax=Bursaphelenchus xylophilus TaxID=6326 RepID=A0A1I7RL44_BURXY|nr:unnamed protein product [Bursaphelenchus xylophilus]CAG9083478.1 unnamed protein product [Bursaphelenchus xylophilus]